MSKKIVFLFLLMDVFYVSTNAQSYPTMVHVQGGSFSMGADDDNAGTTMTVKSFSIAQTETTVLQWKTFCNETGHSMPEAPSWGWIDSHPIVNVSWDDAVAYCDWLSDKTSKIYRLPTEVEWEYAARGGSQSKGFKYSGGQSLDNVGWYTDNSGSQTHPVAQKRANELGLYDMSGNVEEWCKDWYNGSHSRRVCRGGSWFYSAAFCLLAFRYFYTPSNGNGDLGFRLVSPS